MNKDDINVNRSFSQLLISQEEPKKKKPTTTNSQSNNQEENDESLLMNYMQSLKPSYLKVSDQIFKQMLSSAINDSDKVVQSLDTNEKLLFVRQMAEATNNLYYLDLQLHLWHDYYNTGMKEGKWPPQLSKSFAKQHHTCRTYGFPKHVIEQRQKTITQQFQHAINNLQEYMMQLEQNAQHWQPSFDPNILSNAINEYVKKGQQRLRQEFDYKKKMLELDSSDHRLITKFYDLQPNREQVR